MDRPKSGSLEDLVAAAQSNPDPGFWDNLVGGILNRMVGSGQRWAKIAEALDLPAEFRPDRGKMTSEKFTEVAKKLRPTEGWGGVVGDLLATSPLMALPGGPITAGAASGVASALTEPVRGQESLGQLAVRTTEGAALGGAFGILGHLLGGPARHAPEAFNREVLNAAAPPGAGTISHVGQRGIAELQTAWDAAYKKVTPNLRVVADNTLLNDLSAVLAAIPGSGAPADVAKRVDDVISKRIVDVLAANNGVLTGDAVNKVQSGLREVSERFSDIEVPINAVRDAFLAAAQRASPDAAKELAGLRARYPGFIAAQKAASKSTTNEGVFTPDQLASAVTATDTSAHKGASAAGQRPFQDLVNEARSKNIGKVGALGRLIPIIGRASRIVEESPALRATGAAVEAATVPATLATTPFVARQLMPAAPATESTPAEPASATPALGEPLPAGSPADDAEMQQFLHGPLPGSSNAPADDSSEMDRFLHGPLPGASGVLPGLEDQNNDTEMKSFLKQGAENSLRQALYASIEMQESGGRGGRTPVSVSGARGPMQLMPATFQQYARPGEYIDNPDHNRAVGRRMIDDLYNKYGDPRMVAAAYFSGKPNWRSQAADPNGKKTADYVQNVMNRIQAQGLQV